MTNSVENKMVGNNVETKKGETVMETKEAKFNVWEFTKSLMCTKYLEESTEDFTINVKFMDDYTNESKGIKIDGSRKVLHWLAKSNAIKGYEVTERTSIIDGEVKKIYEVKISGFNPSATAISKNGKKFNIFQGAMGRALERQMFNTKATA